MSVASELAPSSSERRALRRFPARASRTGSSACRRRAQSRGRPACRVFDATAERVGQQLLGQRARRTSPAASTGLAEATGPSTVVPSASWPDASTAPPSFLRPPLADAVEVLEREAERIHHAVAARARRVLAVLLQPLAHATSAPRPLSFSFECRHVRRRRRAAACQDVLQDPLAAQHRRRPVRIRRHRQDAALTEQPAALVVRQRDARKWLP